MRMRLTTLALLVASLGLCGFDWPQFRGPQATGLAPDGQNLPETWSATENLAWKSALPGKGLSGPIVVKDRVIVTACSGPRQDRLHVLCFANDTGKLLWERQYWATGRTLCHPKTNMAAPTPASDGQRIFALFATNDLFCLDLDGNLLWLRGLTYDYPNASNSLGMASSPVVVGSTLVVPVENDAESFALGIETATGENRWKVDRPAFANWVSPTVYPRTDGLSAVCLQSSQGLVAYDPHTGNQLWRHEQACGTIASPTVAGDLVFVPLGKGNSGLTVLRPVSGRATPDVVWSESRLAPGTASPIVSQGHIYSVNSAGVLNIADAKSGELQKAVRLKGPFSCSPAIADGHLYIFNEAGLGQVVDLRGDEAKLVSQNDLGEGILCSPAISNGALYVRSDHNLFKISRKK